MLVLLCSDHFPVYYDPFRYTYQRTDFLSEQSDEYCQSVGTLLFSGHGHDLCSSHGRYGYYLRFCDRPCGNCGAWAALNIGVWAMFPVAILFGAAVGLVNGVVVAKFKVPSFMCTLAMLLAVRAVVSWWLQAKVYHCNDVMSLFDGLGVKIPILIVVLAVFAYIFRFTPFGKYTRAIGENEQAIEYTGVSVLKTKIWAFTLSGILAGIAGVFVMVRLGGASNTMGSGMEMRVMLCMFLASIPVAGGSGTAVYKMLIGVLTYFVLDNGLTFLGGTSNFNQMIRGIVLILALFITRLAIERNTKKSIKKAYEGADTAA